MNSSKRFSKRMRYFACSLMLVSAFAQADLSVVQIAPLTGVLADTGKLMQQGATLAINDSNEKGGVHGQKIKLETLDDAYKVEETIRLVRAAANASQKPVAFLGLVGTGNVAALVKQGVIDEAGIPVIGVRSGAGSLRQPGHPLIYHLRASYANEIEKLIEVISSIGHKRFGVLYQDDPFGLDGLEAVKRATTKRQLEIVASAPYEKNTTKIEAAVDALLKHKDLPAIVLVSNTQATAAFINTYRSRGGNAQMYAVSVNNDREIVTQIGAQKARGLGIAQVVPFPTSGVLPLAREYQKLLRKYYPDSQPSVSSMEGYIYGKVLIDALRRAGPKPNRDSLTKALEGAPFELGGYVIDFGPGKHDGSDFVELTMIGAEGKLIR